MLSIHLFEHKSPYQDENGRGHMGTTIQDHGEVAPSLRTDHSEVLLDNSFKDSIR